MELLYAHEHLICENYERGSKPLFENFHIEGKKTFEKYIEEAEIVFLMKGTLYASRGAIGRYYSAGNIVLLPPAIDLKVEVEEETQILVLRVRSAIHLCNIQPLNALFDRQTVVKEELKILDINERLRDFLVLLSGCLDDGLRCKCFIELKAKEIFYYFRAYYPKEELRDFFAPLLTKDYTFTTFVLQNYRRVKTVQQFADLYGYSLSSFEKQFKRVFRRSAYQWMTEQKSKAIYHDLIYTNSSLIELADEYDFSSLSQFCDFCKRLFGNSPGRIRNEQKCLNNLTLRSK